MAIFEAAGKVNVNKGVNKIFSSPPDFTDTNL